MLLKTIDRWVNDKQKGLSASERSALSDIQSIVEDIDQTTKQRRLRNVIETIQDQIGTTRAIVFTQFRPTQDAIADSIRGWISQSISSMGISPAKARNERSLNSKRRVALWWQPTRSVRVGICSSVMS